MLNIGSRSNPSVLNLVLIVILIIAAVNYVLISLDTGDWIGFSHRLAETPNAMIIHCYGKTIHLDRGSNHFSALAEIMNDILSGQKRYDPLSMSPEIYQDYQQSRGKATIEFFYPTALRMQTGDQTYSGVDNLVVPLGGLQARTDAIYGRNQGVSATGAWRVDSTQRLKEYLQNQKICQTDVSVQ